MPEIQGVPVFRPLRFLHLRCPCQFREFTSKLLLVVLAREDRFQDSGHGTAGSVSEPGDLVNDFSQPAFTFRTRRFIPRIGRGTQAAGCRPLRWGDRLLSGNPGRGPGENNHQTEGP